MQDPASSFGPLLDQARDGDNAALGNLLEKQRGWLRQSARRAVPSHLAREEDASDLAQECLAAAGRQIDDFRGRDAGTFRSWLRGIQRNLLKKFFRKHIPEAQRQNTLLTRSGAELPFSNGHTPPVERAARQESLALLTQAIDYFDETDRRLIELRFLSEQSARVTYDELANDLDMSCDALRQRVCRLLKKLATGIPLLSAIQQHRVPSHLATILCWRHFRGWSVERIARELGRDVRAARTLLRQAESALPRDVRRQGHEV